ncbi:FAD-linked oxidase [Artemisia annua]|uniref:FAD-linked oxidase n=1 Tax=Artemisia annua TaxID=35608 RepID=A0A2U1NEK2_ARTAN|nr:FAD-linked oxidase [Artemisia annua]
MHNNVFVIDFRRYPAKYGIWYTNYQEVAMCSFPIVKDGADVAIAAMISTLQVSRVELLDEVVVKAVNLANRKDFSEAPTLMFDVRVYRGRRGFCVPCDVDKVEMVLKVPKSALMTSHSLMVCHRDT